MTVIDLDRLKGAMSEPRPAYTRKSFDSRENLAYLRLPLIQSGSWKLIAELSTMVALGAVPFVFRDLLGLIPQME